MKLDSLVKVVGAADPSAFREIALLCLDKRGFQPSLVDGPHDGGADFLTYALPPSTANFAVQVSVEKNWEKKLRADASKARTRLGADNLLFISSRVITPPLFQEIADDLLRTVKIQVQKMDAKDIASLAERRGFTHEVLAKLDIAVAAVAPRPFQRPDLRQDLAYACAFFGTEAQAFRETVIENAALAVVFQSGGSAARATVVDRVGLSLGLTSSQHAQTRSAIDRMLQDGRLSGRNGTILLDAKARDNWATMRALQERERLGLDAQLDQLLTPHVKNEATRRDAVGTILADLGALWLDTGRATSNALSADQSSVLIQDSQRDRLRHLDAILDTLGIIERAPREKLLRHLAELAAGSSLGRALVAGEVFINLASLKTPHLFRAFGGGRELWALLDTSVAMPLLCSLLYGTAEQDFFVAAQHAYDQLVAHGATMALPRGYLEEVASHLRDAYVLYRDIVDLDPDLRGSKNAFVAHYVALRAADAGKAGSFPSYLAGFGLTESMARGDREVVRDLLMNKLQGLFATYGVRSVALSSSRSSTKRAEEALAYAMRARDDLERLPILVRHDVTTLGWLLDRASDPEVAYVICTWDKLHPHVQSHEEADWDVLDPVALGDVLSLAAPASEDVKIVSPVFIALTLSAEAEKSGAAVWDKLVMIEKENLHDARLRTAARAFKQSWVGKAARDRRSLDLQEAWEAWKDLHLPGPADAGG
jgi:hypothetical protein